MLAGRLLAQLRDSDTHPGQHLPSQREPLVTRREMEILRLVADGLSNKEIGRKLVITEGTVKNHVHNALEKLHMDNRIQAAAYIVRRGLGHPPIQD